MSDTQDYYHRLSARARALRDGIDEAINALLAVDQLVGEVGKADLDLPGVVRETEHRDLQRSIESALFAARAAERTTLLHISEVDHEIGVLSLDLAHGERVSAT